jgi:hypothetical protein
MSCEPHPKDWSRAAPPFGPHVLRTPWGACLGALITERGRSALLDSTHASRRVALIPRCAECETAWLPADEERWRACLAGDHLDEPPEVVFYCEACWEREFK